MPWRTSSAVRAARSPPSGADRPGRGLAPELRRQVLDQQFRAVAEDDGPLDVILQLADVARPVVLAEEPHRLGVDPADLAAVLLGVSFEEELDQDRDVLATLAERGQVDRHDVEPVIEVLAEPARRRSRRGGRGWSRR